MAPPLTAAQQAAVAKANAAAAARAQQARIQQQVQAAQLAAQQKAAAARAAQAQAEQQRQAQLKAQLAEQQRQAQLRAQTQPAPRPAPIPRAPVPAPKPSPIPPPVQQPPTDVFGQYGSYADRMRKEYNDQVAQYKQWGGSPGSAEDWLSRNQAPRMINLYKYEDWSKTQQQPGRGSGPNGEYMPGYDDRNLMSQYSNMIRQQSQNAYDQYAQYQNKAWNDYYAKTKPGTYEYDAYNPYTPRPVPAVVPMPYQDILGSWTTPSYGNEGPGDNFDQWYQNTYKTPGYQQLSNIQRVQPQFTQPDWMRGNFGLFPGEPYLYAKDATPAPTPVAGPVAPR